MQDSPEPRGDQARGPAPDYGAPPDQEPVGASKPQADSEEKPTKAGSFLTELAQIAFFAIALYLILNFAIQTVAVFGPSSYPNLEQGDYLIASKIDYRLHSPQRGDFVIIRDPFNAKENFIKRVIGLPGETVYIHDARIYINGKRLAEPYLSDTEPWTVDVNHPPVQLGKNEYWVMGDNRDHSTDSRDFGPININDFEAKAWIRVWPFTRMGILDSHPPHLAAH